MKFWYYSNVLNNIIDNTNINSGNISVVLKEIGNLVGKEIALQIEDNLSFFKLIKFTCNKWENFSLFKLSLYGNDYYFFENEQSCSCHEKIKNNSYIVRIYIFLSFIVSTFGCF